LAFDAVKWSLSRHRLGTTPPLDQRSLGEAGATLGLRLAKRPQAASRYSPHGIDFRLYTLRGRALGRPRCGHARRRFPLPGMRGAAHLTLCAITLMAVLWLSNKARPGARRRVSRLSLSAARFIHRESPLTLHSAVLDRSPSSRVAGAVSGSLPGTLGAAHLGDDARYRRADLRIW